MNFKRLDESIAFRDLRSSSRRVSLPEVLDGRRVRSHSTPVSRDLSFNYAAAPVDDAILDGLQALANELELVEKYVSLASGAMMNTGEKRLVLHHLARGAVAGPVAVGGRDMRAFYETERGRFSGFARKVRSGEIRGSTGKTFETVVQIGIGGSDLGPKALYLALERWASREGLLKLKARFVSNVDPDDANSTLDDVDPERCLFVLVSKSGTTQETLANELLCKALADAKAIPGFDAARHFVAVTSETSPLARSAEYLDSFYIDDFIGGRYSATSAVGGVVLSLALGPECFGELLEGAHEADVVALNRDIRSNAALLDALIGVYERNVLDMRSTAVLPYSQALVRFAAHLQQVDMESNGKSCDRDGMPLGYATGPVLFGEPGTNGQHSFYQLLHQGADRVPLQFVGFREAQCEFDLAVGGSSSQEKLNANLAAQIVAFAKGKADANPNRHFSGDRPSTLIHGERLTPRSLGALLAHFENKVMFQGFAWNLNSFDQEGVQLGKALAKDILEGKNADSALVEYASMLGVGK